jgi:GH25 family lysozyme M1 (1,4-beta-N-acetylmuramidase)
MAELKKGIDVSGHQPGINWDKVKAAGIDFAMLRIGYGSDQANQDDATFEYNVSECERVGIEWGAYLYSYALDLASAQSEKAHILRLLNGKHPKYPVGFDMEDADGYKAKHGMPSNDLLVDICVEVLSGVEEAGFYATLYASKDWLDNHLNSPKLDRFDKWVAQWANECSYAKPHGLWQYSDAGVIDGISGKVDVDYAYYDFASIMAPKAAPTVAPVVPPAPVKSVDELAHEVIAGTLGNGDARRQALGAQYDAVQARVAELLAPPPPPKSTDELAQEVIKGLLGSGDARRQALGARYDEVQARVEQLLAPPPPPPKSTDELAQEVIKGLLGSGDARRQALGARYDEVQARVEQLMAPPAPPVKSVHQLAVEVIQGLHGSGRERQIALGNQYDAVQAEVTRLMNG